MLIWWKLSTTERHLNLRLECRPNMCDPSEKIRNLPESSARPSDCRSSHRLSHSRSRHACMPTCSARLWDSRGLPSTEKACLPIPEAPARPRRRMCVTRRKAGKLTFKMYVRHRRHAFATSQHVQRNFNFVSFLHFPKRRMYTHSIQAINNIRFYHRFHVSIWTIVRAAIATMYYQTCLLN